MKGTLLLLPNVLGETELAQVFPPSVGVAVATLDGLIAESEKEGRRYLKRFQTKKPLQEMTIKPYNEHTTPQELDELLTPLRRGECWGLISDCGLPCLADPGSTLVREAHRINIDVQAYVGPSSIFLALMLSGLSGQHFAFHGYLARSAPELQKELKALEELSRKMLGTQIWIETPYRNESHLKMALETLKPDTWLCLASDLTLPTQQVITLPVKEWRKREIPPLKQKPTLFLLYVDANH